MGSGSGAGPYLLMKQLKGAHGRRRTVCPAAAAHKTCTRPRHADLNKNPVEGFSAGLVTDDNPFQWEICIIGPPDTP